MRDVAVKRFVLSVGVFFIAALLSTSGNAGTLRNGSTSGGASVTGSLPGQVQWTYYQTIHGDTAFAQLCPPDGGPPDVTCNVTGVGDNILRLINPNGAANGNLAGAKEQTVCAMIYVFDDDQEMGECCGCPLSSTQLATFSVERNLTANWGINSPETSTVPFADNILGSIAIVASAPNTIGVPFGPFGSTFVNTGGGGAAGQCLGASCCDPTNTPGYSVTTASNLLGSITHNQAVVRPTDDPITDASVTFGLTEIALSDDAGGDPTNLIYLQNQCGALIGNGTGGGICNCPLE